MVQNSFDFTKHIVETEDSFLSFGQNTHDFEFYSIDNNGLHFDRFPSKANKN